jgi:hypothetical protein
VLNFVVGVAFGGSEVLGWDWTSSCGEMSSNGCYLKVDLGPGDPSMVRDCSKERSMDTFALESISALVCMCVCLNLKALSLLTCNPFAGVFKLFN